MRLYHGTHTDSASELAAGAPLDAASASARHIDGEPGFYLADRLADAEFFAIRRSTGRVVPYEVTSYAVQELLSRGALRQAIPGRPPPYFEGDEYFVPAPLFPLFNELMGRGEIYVA